MFMSVLCSIIFSFFVFLNISNVRVCFVLRHRSAVQFFVFFISVLCSVVKLLLSFSVMFMSVLYSAEEVLFSFSVIFMSVLCSFLEASFSFSKFSNVHLCFALYRAHFFFVFVNFSNVHLCFVFHHFQFFVFFNFINVLQVLVMYLNLLMHFIAFVFIGCVFILWHFVVQFFVFFNFSNVLQVFIMYLNLWVYLFVFALVVEVLLSFFIAVINFSNVHWLSFKIKVSDWVEMYFFSLTVFGGNLLAGDVHSSVTMDRYVQDRQHLLTHLRPTLGISLLLEAFSYYCNQEENYNEITTFIFESVIVTWKKKESNYCRKLAQILTGKPAGSRLTIRKI